MASKKEEKKDIKKSKTLKKEKKGIKKLIKHKKEEDIEVLELVETNSKTSKRKRKKNKKEKKRKTSRGPVEFAFNFISLVFVFSVGLYYGGRLFYYYSLQHKTTKETAQTLNGLVLTNNKLAENKDDGLHKDENGYFFRGNITNNYVMFANRMFRIMRVNDDNTVKLVTEDLVATFMWGNEKEYESSNVRLWLDKNNDTDVYGIYYQTIPAPDRFLTKTTYTIDKFNETKIESGDVEFKGHVVSVTLNDYVESGGKSGYLNNGKLYFILGYNSDDSNLYIEEDGSIAECDNLDGYGIRAVITLQKNLVVSQGTGTLDDPYIIDQGDDKNYVDSYVKLGDDIWKVYQDKDEKLKMYLNDYIKVDGNEVYKSFSYGSSRLNFFEEGNIGYYLWFEYYPSLPYKNVLVENTYPNGVMSQETDYWYPHAFEGNYTALIGMLNLFDYVSNNNLSDFFRGNSGEDISAVQYSVLANGALEDASVTDSKHIVPVVSISSKSIKSGNGRIDNPYVVG